MKKTLCHKSPVAEREFLHSIAEISQYTGLGKTEIRKCILESGMPVFLTPAGRWTTTKSLLDKWVLVMVSQQGRNRAQKG
jgi:hypothetical protein